LASVATWATWLSCWLLVPLTSEISAWHSAVAVCGTVLADALGDALAAGEDVFWGAAPGSEPAEGTDPEAAADADTDTDGATSGSPAGADVDVDVAAGPGVSEAPGPGPENEPVLAASATPPPANTVSVAASTLVVSILASGDLIICPLWSLTVDSR